MFRPALFLASLLVALSAAAGTVAERSPFTQGHWWNADRPGNGFDIFNANGGVQVLWYTFDEAGRPTWYTANGAVEGLGRDRFPILQHRWVNGRKAEGVVVGALRLTVRNPESMALEWEFGTRTGTWNLSPYFVAGWLRETDHSGSWFNPANSGWGLNVLEQGDVLGGVLFTYGADGSPTWVAGFERGAAGGATMYAASGSCPWCAYRATTTASVGRLAFDFASETRMVLRPQVALAMAPGVNADGASLEMFSRPASWRGADRQLARFDVDALARDHLLAGIGAVGPPSMPIVLPSPAPAVTFSTTNLQEAGVDESDLVKSNGTQVYAYAASASGARTPAVRIVRVSADGQQLAVGGSVPLASGPDTPMAQAGLYLDGARLVSVTGSNPEYFYVSPWSLPASWRRGATHVEILGLADPDRPATAWRAQVDGHLVASRRIGTRLYLVTRSTPDLPGYVFGTVSAATAASNQRILDATTLADLLPKVKVNGGPAAPAVAASAIYAPPAGGRTPTAELTLVTAIDLAAPAIAQSLAIAGPVEAVYASTGNLYLATSRYDMRRTDGTLLPVQPTWYLTDVHQVRLGATAMTVVGSTAVEGALGTDADKAPFRFGEHAGRLHVVTSSTSMWETRNRLTILEPSVVAPGLLKTVSWLPNAARPESLGKPGELLYGTRFAGDRLYAVTFKKTDPLYVVDLANAADPRIAGSLEVPGFSDYLHPLPGNLLLGFGKDARPAGTAGDGQFAWFQGLQLTLFDVSNAGVPREVQRLVVGKRGSDSALLDSHHAFATLRRADGSLAITLPASVHDGTAPLYGTGDTATWPWSYSGLLRFELRGDSPANAQLSLLPPLVSHSAAAGTPLVGGDPGRIGGRAVLFPNGTLYYGNGLFWHQGGSGSASGAH